MKPAKCTQCGDSIIVDETKGTGICPSCGTVFATETVAEDGGGKVVRSKGRTAALTLAKLAILSAISYILYMFVKFPLPMLFPSFLDLQISDLPALIGGFAMGPWYGCIIIVVKCLLKMPFTGTACVGELGDIVMGIAFVLPASFIYKYHKTRKGALLSLAVGVLSSTAAACLSTDLCSYRFICRRCSTVNGSRCSTWCRLCIPAQPPQTFTIIISFSAYCPSTCCAV